MSNRKEQEKSKILQDLSKEDREKIVEMLAKFIVEQKKERERLEGLKKL